MGSTSFLMFSYPNLFFFCFFFAFFLLFFAEPVLFRNLYHIFLASVGTFSGYFLYFIYFIFLCLFWFSL